MVVMAPCVQAQVAEVPRARASFLGLGMTSMTGFYSDSNEGEASIAYAPTVLGCWAMSPSLALRGGVAYRRNQTNRESGNATQRRVRQTTTGNVVVPALLQLTLNPEAPRFHTALFGGLTFWHINQRGQQTDYYYDPSRPVTEWQQKLNRKHLYTFLTGGFNASYQLAPRWVVLTDLTVNFRLGEKTEYYEYFPSVGMQLGAGYCWGTAR